VSTATEHDTPREPLAKKSLVSGLAPGATIGGHYVVKDALGKGGMAEVYLAVDERLDRPVALKVLSSDATDADDDGRARFLREAKALARVEHTNVVRVYASGEDAGRAWMALEVVDGEPLSALCDGGAIDEETAVLLAAQVARGLAAVHRQGVVHRDVKPSNVLVDQDATVKLIDFGVAHVTPSSNPGGGFLTRSGVVVGTPHFMSPEQARGAPVDAACDAWGLGATLFALLTGAPPFYGSDTEPDVEILARVLRDPVPDVRARAPATSAPTAALLAQLLDKDAARRPKDLDQIAANLEGIAAGAVDVTTTAPSSSSSEAAAPAADAAAAAAAAAPTSPTSTSAEVADVAVAGGDGSSVARVVAGLAVVVLVGVSGVALGRFFTDPVERVVKVPVEVPVERIVEVQVPAPAPVPTPTAAPSGPEPKPPATAAAHLDAVRGLVGPALEEALTTLISETATDVTGDAPATEALATLAAEPGAAGDIVVAKAAELSARPFDVVVSRTLMRSSRSPVARQLDAVDRLLERRNDTALLVLSETADRHQEARVRAKARAAKDSIFRVEP